MKWPVLANRTLHTIKGGEKGLTNHSPGKWSFDLCWPMRGLEINCIVRRQHTTKAQTFRLLGWISLEAKSVKSRAFFMSTNDLWCGWAKQVPQIFHSCILAITHSHYRYWNFSQSNILSLPHSHTNSSKLWVTTNREVIWRWDQGGGSHCTVHWTLYTLHLTQHTPLPCWTF